MHVDVLTIFPELFDSFLETSLVGKALDKAILHVAVHDLRSFTTDRHRTVDDEPYGGGGGMVMTAPVWQRAVRAVCDGRKDGSDSSKSLRQMPHRVALSPQGEPLTDAKVRSLATRQSLVLLCGRYEGIDERVRQSVVDEEISIGDFVLSGGELPAMVLIEALSRQTPGVVGLPESVENDSFRNGLLDHPHYTRPRTVEGIEVPAVLLSGDHGAIRRFRRRESLRATLLKRPELLSRMELVAADREALEELARQEGVDLAGVLE